MILDLVGLGFEDRILLGGDVGRRSLRVGGGGLGVAGLVSSLIPALEERGVGTKTIEAALIANPARFLEIDDAHA